MSQSDEPLLMQAAQGDDDAMTALLQRYGPQVRGRINGRIAQRYRSAFDEDDVMQVTYLEAFLCAGGFAPSGFDGFVVWLTRIAKNNLRDAVKELSRQPPPSEKVQRRWGTRRQRAESQQAAAARQEPTGACVVDLRGLLTLR